MRLIMGLVVGLVAGYLLTEAFGQRNKLEEEPSIPIPPPPPSS